MNRFSRDLVAGWHDGQMIRCPCGQWVNLQNGHVPGCPGGQISSYQSDPVNMCPIGQSGSCPNCHMAAYPPNQRASSKGDNMAGCPIPQGPHWTNSYIAGCPESQRSSWANATDGREIGSACGQRGSCPCGKVIGPLDASVLKRPIGQADISRQVNRCPCGQPLSNLSSQIARCQTGQTAGQESRNHFSLPGKCNIIYGKSLVPVQCNKQSKNENSPTDEECDLENKAFSEDHGPCVASNTVSSRSTTASTCMDRAKRGHMESVQCTGGSKMERRLPRKSFLGCRQSYECVPRSDDGVLLYCMPVDASAIFPCASEHPQRRNQEDSQTLNETVDISNPDAANPAARNCHTIVYKTVYKTQGEDPFPGKIFRSSSRKAPERSSTYVEANAMDSPPKIEPTRLSINESVQTDSGKGSRSERPSFESDDHFWSRRNS